MPRGQEPWCKFEPSFVLGLSRSGRAYQSLSELHQLLYLRLWAVCMQMRTDTFDLNSERTASITSRLIGKRTDVIQRLFAELSRVTLAVEVSENCYKLNGFREKHKNFRLVSSPNGDKAGSNEGSLAPRTGTEAGRRSREVEKTTPQPPTPQTQSERHAKSGGGGNENQNQKEQAHAPAATATADKISDAVWRSVARSFPALAERGYTQGSVGEWLAGRNGESALALAALAGACADSSVRVPASAAEHRIKSGGVAPELLRAAHGALLVGAARTRKKRFTGVCACGERATVEMDISSRTWAERCRRCGKIVELTRSTA